MKLLCWHARNGQCIVEDGSSLSQVQPRMFCFCCRKPTETSDCKAWWKELWTVKPTILSTAVWPWRKPRSQSRMQEDFRELRWKTVMKRKDDTNSPGVWSAGVVVWGWGWGGICPCSCFYSFALWCRCRNVICSIFKKKNESKIIRGKVPRTFWEQRL